MEALAAMMQQQMEFNKHLGHLVEYWARKDDCGRKGGGVGGAGGGGLGGKMLEKFAGEKDRFSGGEAKWKQWSFEFKTAVGMRHGR